MTLLRTFHTVRYLKPVQIVNRIDRQLRPLGRLPRVDGDYHLARRSAVGPAVVSDGGYDAKSFSFLNTRVPFAGASRWKPAQAERLWVYQLHCFRYLWGLEPLGVIALITDWIEQNRDPRGPGWEPYTLSLRVREWIEWLCSVPAIDEHTRRAVIDSVAQQVLALERQLEYHLLGNHLLENAITLCWAGLSLRGRSAARWLELGTRLLRSELALQLLADGVHEERSPMYQAVIAEALLRLGEVAETSVARVAADAQRLAANAGSRMREALGRLVHPDGDYALLNDCSLGMAPRPDQLASRFGTIAMPARGIWQQTSAGYFGVAGDGSYLVFDAGPIGPDHQPGHGHADALSFELSHRGRRIFADTGTFSYSESAIREHDRSTAAHNTIEVDGASQSELWAAFRCGRRARIERARAVGAEDGYCISGRYRGPGQGPLRSVVHARQLAMRGNELQVHDEINASGAHRARVLLHLGPGLELEKTTQGWLVKDGSRELASVHCGSDVCWSATTSPYHPEFGKEVTRRGLVAETSFRDRMVVRWSLQLH